MKIDALVANFSEMVLDNRMDAVLVKQVQTNQATEHEASDSFWT